MLRYASKITRKIIVLSKAFDETSRHGLSYLTSKLNSRAPRKLSELVGGEESRSARLAQMVAATSPLGRLVFPAKAVERSHWCGRPRGAVAIARHRPMAPTWGERRRGDCVFWPASCSVRSLSSLTPGASRDPTSSVRKQHNTWKCRDYVGQASRRYRRIRPAIEKTFSASYFWRGRAA
jgi:hypothetical protein